ncbi:hypothetical protein [uncultured Methylobacterium sp.]|uniref:hypothetical protein n=1 Tax=uncultured Methylobacterium sp. TaxID=157278 RepID=UPI002587F07D|nr:hypothetical protein [uncultured Methylobacterium sp.]
MATLPELVTQALVDLRAATASILGLEARVQAKFDSNTTTVTTIIQQFISRPASINVFCDPVRGDDANDGSTPDKAKKSLDGIVASMTGPSGVAVLLLEDAIMRRRSSAAGPLVLWGCQRSNNAYGYIFTQRTVGFLGIAENSPIQGPSGNSTTAAGIFMDGPKLTANFINFVLPDQPANQSFPAHLTSSASLMAFNSCNVSVSGANAGSLIGVLNGRASVFGSFVLGANVPGHLFKDVPAGANPNAQFAYETNITSA